MGKPIIASLYTSLRGPVPLLVRIYVVGVVCILTRILARMQNLFLKRGSTTRNLNTRAKDTKK